MGLGVGDAVEGVGLAFQFAELPEHPQRPAARLQRLVVLRQDRVVPADVVQCVRGAGAVADPFIDGRGLRGVVDRPAVESLAAENSGDTGVTVGEAAVVAQLLGQAECQLVLPDGLVQAPQP